jgi:hypothetical protein
LTICDKPQLAVTCPCALHCRVYFSNNSQFLRKANCRRLVWQCWSLVRLSSTFFISWILPLIAACLVGPNLNFRTTILPTCYCEW